MKTKLIILYTIVILVLSIYGCSKNCECINYTSDGEVIDPNPEIKSMPKSLGLECSFFNTCTDTTDGLICK